MKIAESYKHVRAQLAILVIASAILLLFSFLPDSRAAFNSSETRFSETSAHGLGIVPASCATYGAAYYHTALSPSTDGLGYVLPPGAYEYGINDANARSYICAGNTSSNIYFIPGKTANEVNTFLAHQPPGVRALGTSY